MRPDRSAPGTHAGAIGTPAAGVIDLWAIRLDVSAGVAARLATVLDDREKGRMERLHGEALQTRFAVAHAAVRHILGECLNVPPQAVTFSFDVNGKPSVLGLPLAFSLTHSGDVAVCAVAAGGRLGVDVEVVRPIADADNLASRYFSRDEARGFLRLPATERVRAFFDVWTRKEAFMKATGEGMSRPLDSFEVTVGSEPARLVSVDPSEDVSGWWMQSFDPWPGYVGTLAHDRPTRSVIRRIWSRESSDRRADIAARLPSCSEDAIRWMVRESTEWS